MTRKIGIGALMAVVLLVGLYVVTRQDDSADGAASSASCVPTQRPVIGHGAAPGDKEWRIVASVKPNNGCDAWLLNVEFYPGGTIAGSWRGSWSIPAKGHLPPTFTISAQDEAQHSGRAISGITGSAVRTVILIRSSGAPLRVHPRFPSKKLRKRFVWLRHLRYLMRLYPSGSKVTALKLLDFRGKTLATVHPVDGLFNGPGPR
jgi:hypothetical protein